MNKRVLIVSNQPLSEKTSNGRTLKNLLLGFNAEELAQFYLHGEPDFSCCKNYYRVSDGDALRSVFHPTYRKCIKGKVFERKKTEKVETQQPQQMQKIAKSCKNLYLRNIIWSLGRWWTKDFDKFLDEFSPQAVLLYAGDASFMFDIATRIAKQRKIPLYMYNCENYVLKEKLYAGVKQNSIWHLLLRQRLRQAYSRFMKQVKHCFYITEYLENKYQAVYPHPKRSNAVYTAASMENYRDEHTEPENFTLLYCGNLGVGRPSALYSLANTLYSVDPTAKLKIFGAFQNKETEEIFTKCPNVVFGGKIPYEQVLEETKKCSMVVHCENPDRVKNLECAFSTKIADYLACGIPILIYAIREYPFVQYLDKHKAAHIAEDEDELQNILQQCIENSEFKTKYIGNALTLAEQNHNLKKNGQLVKNIICSED